MQNFTVTSMGSTALPVRSRSRVCMGFLPDLRFSPIFYNKLFTNYKYVYWLYMFSLKIGLKYISVGKLFCVYEDFLL